MTEETSTKTHTTATESDNWNNRMRDITMSLEKKIPTVGGLIAWVTGIFWPENKDDIWDLVKDQVSELIDKKILEKELEERRSEINALKTSMLTYSEVNNHEKGSIMSAMLVNAENIYEKLIESSNDIHLLPLAVTMSHLHLSLLIERFQHGKEIFDGEDSSNVWRKNLVDKHDEYHQHFINCYPKWEEWRFSKISYKLGKKKIPTIIPPFFTYSAYGEITDQVADIKLHGESERNSNEKAFLGTCLAAKAYFENSAKSEMASIMSPTFVINKFLPDHPTQPVVPSILKKITFGPYCQCFLIGFLNSSEGGSIDETCGDHGRLTELELGYYNFFDKIKIKNDKGDVSEVKGMEEEKIYHELIRVGDDTSINEMLVTFASQRLCKLDIMLTNGTNFLNIGKDYYGMDSVRWRSNDEKYALTGIGVQYATRKAGFSMVEFYCEYKH